MGGWWDGFLQWLGYAVCHQLPERTIHFGAHPLFVCARDTGLYAGFFLSAAAVVLPWRRKRGGFPSRPWQAAALACFLYFAVDAFTSALGWRESSDFYRFTSGLLMGAAAALFIGPMVNRLAWGAPREARLLGSGVEVSSLFLTLAAACAVFLPHPSWMFRPAQALLLACFAGTLCYLNFALLASVWTASDHELPPRLLACFAAASLPLAAAELALAHALHCRWGQTLSLFVHIF